MTDKQFLRKCRYILQKLFGSKRIRQNSKLFLFTIYDVSENVDKDELKSKINEKLKGVDAYYNTTVTILNNKIVVQF